jgi:hypothetical protein
MDIKYTKLSIPRHFKNTILVSSNPAQRSLGEMLVDEMMTPNMSKMNDMDKISIK